VVNFGQSTDLVLQNNTAGNSSCLIIANSVPAGNLDLLSHGTLVRSAPCGGYRADHFSDQSRKHYEHLKLRFLTPKAPSPKICKATYKVIADSGGKASKSTIVATNPNCGGWSGTITFHFEGDATLEGGQKNFERSVHQTEYLDVSITLQNGVGAAASHAHWDYHSLDYQQALRGQALTRIETGSVVDTGSADGGSEDSVEVKVAKDGTYSVAPQWKIAVGERHTIIKDHGKVIGDTTLPCYANPTFSKGIYGKTASPRHVQGSQTEENPYGYNKTGKSSYSIDWNLTLTPARN
jgi:hypothetical protein